LALAAASNDVKLGDLAADEGLDLVQRLAIEQGEAFEDAPNELPGCFRHGLAGLPAVGGNFLRHVIRAKETGFIRKSPREKATTLINKLATETGGRAFFPESLSELPQIATEIIRDLRTQYVLSYNPTNKAQDGSYRAIRVTVDQPNSAEKRIALTRTGRLAKTASEKNAPKAPPVRLPGGATTPTRKP